MTPGGGKRWIAFVLLALAVPADSKAQDWILLEPLEWQAFVEFDGDFEDRTDQGSSEILQFEEGFRLRQESAILDPRIARLSLDLEPIFEQTRVDAPGDTEDSDGLRLNYSGNLSLYEGAGHPLSANVGAARATGDIDGSLGSRTEFTNDARDASINWTNSYFPMTLLYSERLRDETFRSGLSNAETERDDKTQRLSLRGRSSKMNLLLQREEFDDQTPTNNDRDTNQARLFHRFDWGRGSRLDSNFDYFDRSGFNEREQLSLRETATIRHAENLESTTAYSYETTSAADTDTEIHSGDFNLTHRLYRNLTTGLGLNAETADFDTSQSDRIGGDLSLGYSKRIPWGGTLSLGGSGGYSVTDRDSNDGFVDVVDEPHVVPPGSRSVLLNQRFIDVSSIVVTDTTNTQLDEGPNDDYVVRELDQGRVELIFDVIWVNQTILASYRFQEQPSAKFSSVPYSFNAALDFGQFSVFHRMSGENQHLISGEEDSLTDRIDMTSGLEYRWSRARTTVILGAERRYDEIDSLENETYALSQSLTRNISPALSLNLSTRQNFAESDGRETDLYTADFSANWRPLRNLTVRPHANAFFRKESGRTATDDDREEKFLGAGVDARWFWRKLDFDLSYNYGRQRGDVTELDEHRIILRLTRNF